MAHELATMLNGRTAMAYVGSTPWHGLGQALTVGADFETWLREAGMDFTICRSRVRFGANDAPQVWDARHVLFRSDTKAPLAVVSDGYKIVQPAEVLEFFRDLCQQHGFTLETAGVLYDGARYWALAKLPLDFSLPGNDRVGAYALLATSADGSLATTAQITATRVVCNNTLRVAMGSKGETAIRVRHSSEFRATKIKIDLGLVSKGWRTFEEKSKALAARKLTRAEALGVLIDVMGDKEKAAHLQPNARPMAEILRLYERHGIAHDAPSAQGTAWGLLNAATEYYDHHAGRSDNSRLASAWFGKAATVKTEIYESLLDRAIGATMERAAAPAPSNDPPMFGGLLDSVLSNGVAA